ncbi:MAG: tyrosine--tRNA ligase [Anaerolineaceae bacterium]|nr:tyrosine--tRNA ligase [Anaerolineaceae bacterium]
MNNVLEELKWRGLIKETTEGVERALENKKVTLYNGFDPTGDSLHIGHLVPLMALARFQRYGHTPIALAGGGTAMIGDPTGRSAERTLLSIDEIEGNVANIKKQLAHLLDFEVKSNTALLLNNIDWLEKMSAFDLLRDIGKHFTINYMMAKDSVKSRITRDQGISYTEFSYMLLQSYDYMHLNEKFGCTLQTGGSDQWGNITAGVELIRRAKQKHVNGIAYPLITRSDGSKFGKTASGNSVWLDSKRTSPYRFYQFLLNTDDRDVINYLKYFTWLEKDEIEQLAFDLESAPEMRTPQKMLAKEMTKMIHGATDLAKAEQASKVLFGGDLEGLMAGDIADIFSEVPRTSTKNEEFTGEGKGILDLLCETGLTSSKGEARRLLKNGGISLNNQKVTDEKRKILIDNFIEGEYLIIRKGKKTYHLMQIIR